MNPAEDLVLNLKNDWIHSEHASYRPPSWPPPRDWVVVQDPDGAALSRWGDPIWDLSPFEGTAFGLNFGHGRVVHAERIDPANADLLRLVATWLGWGDPGVRTAGTLKMYFTQFRNIFALCSRAGISAADLMRFPNLLEQIPKVIAPSLFKPMIGKLHMMLDAREWLGFSLVNRGGLKWLAAHPPSHESVQTPYIPPRIWTYQLTRLRQCLEEFSEARERVEACFKFVVDAYAHNYGSLTKMFVEGPEGIKRPFQGTRSSSNGLLFHGPFSLTAQRFGLLELMARWTEFTEEEVELRTFSGYLTLVQYAGLAYIANFTMQRIEEAACLRTDCLRFEQDPRVGRIPIVCGPTTKTDPDSDARWPASPSVQLPVDALTSIARLRIACAVANPVVAPPNDAIANPALFEKAHEPWTGSVSNRYGIRKSPGSYSDLLKLYPKLFDIEQLRIAEEDLRVAKLLTPNLPPSEYSVGMVWPLAWHQLRRTTAVNMFASGILSDSSMQFLLKHSSRLMPLYYGRGYTRLQLNEEVAGLVASAMYESMAMSVREAARDRFVSPHEGRKKEVINLIASTDAQQLVRAARKGQISLRENRLGFCMKRGPCSYGGYESVARCGGGDGKDPCNDVLFDRTKRGRIIDEVKAVRLDMVCAKEGSPRAQALRAESRAMENYLRAVDE